MSVSKELIEQERQLVQKGQTRDVHLHREGSFLRGYDWSAWLCCRYRHDFKVNKRVFKGIDKAVAYIAIQHPTNLERNIQENKFKEYKIIQLN